MKNKIMRSKFLKPFNNRRAGSLVNVIIGLIIGTIALVSLTWVIIRGTELYVKVKIDTVCYNLADAIATNGKINEAMQTDLFKKFNSVKFYTGDYEVEVYRYDYENYFSKQFVGSSSNGSRIPDTSFNKGEMVHVVFKAESTQLDEFSRLFDGESSPIGIASESSAKVD